MKRALSLCLTALVLILWSAPMLCYGQSAGGVAFAPERRVDGRVLTLRGTALLRWMLFAKAYAGAFYLAEKADTANALGEAPRQLVLHYFHSIPAEDLAEATEAMIRKNVPPDQYNAIKPKIDQINALYRDVDPGGRYTATYIPGTGTTLALNGEPLGTVSGKTFAKAYFAIWLGEKPIDKKFRDKLLDAS
jgi:hypothetical protein